MNDVQFVRIQRKPGSLERVRAWAAEFHGRKDEALASRGGDSTQAIQLPPTGSLEARLRAMGHETILLDFP